MKNLCVFTAAVTPLLISGQALAQTGTMMGGGSSGFGWMGGHGGFWMPALVIVAVVAIVVLVIRGRGK